MYQDSQPEPKLTETGQTQFAYRLAVMGLFINATLTLIESLLFSEQRSPYEIIGLLLVAYFGYRLWKFDARARRWVLILVIGGGIAFSCLYYVTYDQLTFLITTFIQFFYSLSIALLLTGKSYRWRIILAVELFILFVIGPTGAIYLLYWFQL